MGFLNIYGTPLHGPYAHNHHQGNDVDPYTDTLFRMQHGLEVYKAQGFGVPEFVFFRGEMWDLLVHSDCPTAGHKRSTLIAQVNLLKGCGIDAADDYLRANVKSNHSARIAIIDKFIEDTTAGVEALRAMLPQNATLGVHTVPDISWGRELFTEFQNGLRYAAGSTGAVLFDFNIIFSSSSQPLMHFLRDLHHPQVDVAAAFGAIIVRAFRTWYCR